MMFHNSFPQTPVCLRVRFALPLSCLLLVVGLFSNAQGQSERARPVARLVGSANHTLAPEMSRPRTVALAHAPAATIPVAASASSDERRAFDLINAARRARGESPLVWDEGLTRMARQHSQSMARQGFISHEGPDGRTVLQRAQAMGLRGWDALAENVAYNQGYDDPAGFAVERWLKSEKHRENVMHAAFTHTGLGVARTTDGRVYFTQVFVAR